MEAEKIINKFGWLTSGWRVLMLTKRSKEGGKANRPDRIAVKKVSKNEEEFVEILQTMLDNRKENYRIYCTINPRDPEKAIRKFKELQLDHDFQSDEIKYGFYNDLKNRWISSLMKPSSRAETYFLIDIDNNDRHGLDYKKTEEELEKKEVTIIDTYKTKNGWHIITLPFNYPKVMPDLQKFDHVKTDALALLKY